MFDIFTNDESFSLLDICIARTGALLRDGYYQQDGSDSGSINPFAFVPVNIVNVLFQVLTQARLEKHTSRVGVLRPLLTSGRLTDLALTVRDLEPVDIAEIFRLVTPFATNVRRIDVRRLSNVGKFAFDDPWSVITVEKFISKSKNLEYVNVFGGASTLEILLRLPNLKSLCIHQSRPFSQISINESVVCHHNLTHLEIHFSPVPVDLLVGLLMCCPNLESLKAGIAVPLKRLLCERGNSGKASNTTYRLRKYRLDLELSEIELLQAAVQTFPFTTDLRLNIISEHRHRLFTFPDIELTGFENLESLGVQWQGIYMGPMNFHPGLGHALKCVGSRIEKLYLSEVCVDFEAIGKFCPNLKVLKVLYEHSYDVGNPHQEYFTQLEELFITCYNSGVMELEHLQILTRGCKGLKVLDLLKVFCLTDEVLGNLLRKNSFSNLRVIKILPCCLTEEGIRLLLESCRCLKQISIYSLNIASNQNIEQIVRSIWPSCSSSLEAHLQSKAPIVRLLDSLPVFERRRGQKRPFT